MRRLSSSWAAADRFAATALAQDEVVVREQGDATIQVQANECRGTRLDGLGSDHAQAGRNLVAADVHRVGAASGNLVAQRVQHLKTRVDTIAVEPLARLHHAVATL